MALEQYAVQLTPEERERLSQLIRSGKSSARIIARARTLLLPSKVLYFAIDADCGMELTPEERERLSTTGGGRFGHLQGYGVPRQTAVR